MAEPTLEQLRERRRALQEKRESLVTQVQTGDRQVRYDLTQADAALADLDRQISAAQGGNRTKRIHFRGVPGWRA